MDCSGIGLKLNNCSARQVAFEGEHKNDSDKKSCAAAASGLTASTLPKCARGLAAGNKIPKFWNRLLKVKAVNESILIQSLGKYGSNPAVRFAASVVGLLSGVSLAKDIGLNMNDRFSKIADESKAA